MYHRIGSIIFNLNGIRSVAKKNDKIESSEDPDGTPKEPYTISIIWEDEDRQIITFENRELRDEKYEQLADQLRDHGGI
ncbi:MAG: hypothetical protein GY804_02585 [Alphaproteobacteria bacterium]|nr:hypothetical protein [Alphaproteobacteria bacterium]